MWFVSLCAMLSIIGYFAAKRIRGLSSTDSASAIDAGGALPEKPRPRSPLHAVSTAALITVFGGCYLLLAEQIASEDSIGSMLTARTVSTVFLIGSTGLVGLLASSAFQVSLRANLLAWGFALTQAIIWDRVAWALFFGEIRAFPGA